MKKKLLSLIVTFMVLVTGVISLPLVSNAATTENYFPFREASDPNSGTATRISYNEKTTPAISQTYNNNGYAYYFTGKLQKIILQKKATVNLYIYVNSVIDNRYNQGSVYFGIFSQPNTNYESKIINCFGSTISNDPRSGSCTTTLNPGTYYIALYSHCGIPAQSITNTVSIYANYKYIDTTPTITQKINISNVSTPRISNQRYTGRAISPSIKLTYGNRILVENEDYLLSYSYNTNPGKAYGFIYGVGDFYGTKRFTFNIKVTPPKKAAVKKVKSKKKKRLTVYWKRDSKATGYQVVIAQNKKFKKGKKTANISKNKTTSKTFKRLKSKKKYYAKVRAYKVIDGKKYYGAYSKIKSVKVK